MSPDLIPDYTEPVIALRKWAVSAHDIVDDGPWTLRSINGRMEWPFGETAEAVCYAQGSWHDATIVLDLMRSGPVQNGNLFIRSKYDGTQEIKIRDAKRHLDFTTTVRFVGVETGAELVMEPDGVGGTASLVGMGYVEASGVHYPVSPGVTSITLPVDACDWTVTSSVDGTLVTGHTFRFGHDAPDEACRCGIYAAADWLTIDRVYVAPEERTVVGVVALAGKIIPGSNGWRAEKARIVALLDPTTVHPALVDHFRLGKAQTHEIMRGLAATADAYGVPLLARKHLPSLTRPEEIGGWSEHR